MCTNINDLIDKDVFDIGYMTTEEAEKDIGICRYNLFRLVLAGKLSPPQKMGGRSYWAVPELLEVLWSYGTVADSI